MTESEYSDNRLSPGNVPSREGRDTRVSLKSIAVWPSTGLIIAASGCATLPLRGSARMISKRDLRDFLGHSDVNKHVQTYCTTIQRLCQCQVSGKK
jgi:hypothetical protein